MSLLTLKNLSVSKPGSRSDTPDLLRDVNCEIEAGQITCIIGPNGAGKSTLLKAIIGDWPYNGLIKMPSIEKDVNLRARQIAMLAQFNLLNFPFRVDEVVALARIPHQTGHQRDQEIIDAALELMDIGFLKHRLYTELSGGEKQRVQLARIFAQIWEPDEKSHRILLLDEPTTALDMGHQHDLMRAIKHFANQGATVIMVLHDINLAARYADRMLALLCGEQIAYGTVTDVITVETMRRLYNVDAQILKDETHFRPIVVSQ